MGESHNNYYFPKCIKIIFKENVSQEIWQHFFGISGYISFVSPKAYSLYIGNKLRDRLNEFSQKRGYGACIAKIELDNSFDGFAYNLTLKGGGVSNLNGSCFTLDEVFGGLLNEEAVYISDDKSGLYNMLYGIVEDLHEAVYPRFAENYNGHGVPLIDLDEFSNLRYELYCRMGRVDFDLELYKKKFEAVRLERKAIDADRKALEADRKAFEKEREKFYNGVRTKILTYLKKFFS